MKHTKFEKLKKELNEKLMSVALMVGGIDGGIRVCQKMRKKI